MAESEQNVRLREALMRLTHAQIKLAELADKVKELSQTSQLVRQGVGT